MRVLVVSEGEVERLTAVTALRLHADAEVVEATTADEAGALLRVGEHVDVLVIDGDLRPKGGYALLYAARARDELAGRAGPPALMMAGRAQDQWLAAWAGANTMLVKPVDPFELARLVRDLVGEPPAPHGDRGAAAEQLAVAIREHR